MKKIEINPLILYSLLGVIILLFLISFFGIKDANECLSNPLVYGAERGSQSEGGKMFCSCRFSNPLYAPLYFDDTNITTDINYVLSESSIAPTGGISIEN